MNRSVAVLVLRAYQSLMKKELFICEPLTGSGVRGIRVALEVNGIKSVVINDLNPLAAKLARYNVKKNALYHKIIVENMDANFLLNNFTFPTKRFDVIDIDPFGSPSIFVDSALRALRNKGLLALTATDTAPLCGVKPQACIRKYFSTPLRTEYCHELAIRILISYLNFTAAKYDLNVKVLLSYFAHHYVRIYTQIKHGAEAANKTLKEIGYIFHCFNCLYREWFYGFINVIEPKCCVCGGKMSVAGPLWLGELANKEFCLRTLVEEEGNEFRREVKIIRAILKECDAPPTYYVLDRISKKLNLPSPRKANVIKKLVDKGYQALPTHFDPQGVRSNSPIDVIEKAIKTSI
jgi:tRNA (guanine26-N2/guanine27-N2)-dimethyltransferase